MKKIKIICLLSCLVVLFTACNKEGVFNPSKKIQKIITYESETELEYQEVWTWNDDNTLAKIDYYEKDDLVYTCIFKYDGKRLTSINIPEFKTRIDYKYDGKQLVESDIYGDGDLEMTAVYTHENGKVSRIELKDFTALDYKMLKWVLPIPSAAQEQIASVQKEDMSKNTAKTEYLVTMDLTWNKNNVSKIDYSSTVDGSEVLSTLSFEFTYDNFINPTYNLLSELIDPSSAPGTYSKNNMLTSKISRDGNVLLTEEYAYTYEGKYPITCDRINTEYPISQKYIYND